MLLCTQRAEKASQHCTLQRLTRLYAAVTLLYTTDYVDDVLKQSLKMERKQFRESNEAQLTECTEAYIAKLTANTQCKCSIHYAVYLTTLLAHVHVSHLALLARVRHAYNNSTQ
jgi:hypothetical protein